MGELLLAGLAIAVSATAGISYRVLRRRTLRSGDYKALVDNSRALTNVRSLEHRALQRDRLAEAAQEQLDDQGVTNGN